MNTTFRKSSLALGLVAALAAPSGASAASISIKAPKRVSQWALTSVTWQGNTAPETEPNRIVRIVGTKKKKCPATVPSKLSSSLDYVGSANVFHLGGFSGANLTNFTKAGTFRLCPYLSDATLTSNVYTLAGSARKITVRKASSSKYKLAKKIKSGTWTATAGDINGGGPSSALTFTISGGEVTAASVSGVPTTNCRTDVFDAPVPVAGAASWTGPRFPSGNPIIRDSFNAEFGSDLGNFSIVGDSASTKRIYGSVYLKSPDGSCSGGFGFVAKRS